MMLDRRSFIGVVAAAAGAGALPGQATATMLSGSVTGGGECGADALIVGTGLPTDAAFARGAAATGTHRFLVNADGYLGLLARFEACRGMRILTLTSPANALLIEQALRDGGGRLQERSALRAPTRGDRLAWAHEIGGRLAGGDMTGLRLSQDGHLHIALAATL